MANTFAARPGAALTRAAQRAALVLVLAAALTQGMARAEPARYRVDPDHATVAFLVSHIGYADVLGIFGAIKGSLTYDTDAPAVSNIEIVVETESISTNHRRRDGHLRSPDFLNVREFPEMTFRADGAERTGERSARVHGTLTLLGVSRPLTLDVTLNKAAAYPIDHRRHTLGLSARGSFRRSDFGMTYGVPDLVGDEVKLIIEVEAVREG